MTHAKSSRAIAVAVAALAAASLFAGIGVWFGYKAGVVAVVVTPRQYVPIAPGGTQTFTAVARRSDGSATNVTATGASWQCSPAIGIMSDSKVCVTAAEPAYGWVQASYSGLTTRVYIKATSSGWNPDVDTDGDGLSDSTECISNMAPAAITLLNVRAKLSQAQ